MSGIGPGPPGRAAGTARAEGRRDRRRPRDRRRRAVGGRSHCRNRPEGTPRDPGRYGPRWGRRCSLRLSSLLSGARARKGRWRNVRPAPYRMAPASRRAALSAHRGVFATHLGPDWPGRSNRIAPWPPHTTLCARHCARSRTPPAARDIVSAGLVEGIEQRGGLVQVSLLTDRAHAEAMEPVRREVEVLLRPPAGGDQRHRRADGAQGAGCRGAAAGRGRSRRRSGRRRRRPGQGQGGHGPRARPWPAGWAEAGAAAAGGEGDRRGGLRQGRRGQIHRGGEPRGGAGAARACGSGCWTPTSTARACRACSG